MDIHDARQRPSGRFLAPCQTRRETTETMPLGIVYVSFERKANMPVYRLNDKVVRYEIGEFNANVSTCSQYVTVFKGLEIAGSLSRRRVIDRKSSEWTIFDRNGRKLGEHNLVSPLLHILRRETAV